MRRWIVALPCIVMVPLASAQPYPAKPVGEEFKAVIDRDIAKRKPLAQKVDIKVD